jgi:hypothetical protein
MWISETATTPVTAFCTIKLNIINTLKHTLKSICLKQEQTFYISTIQHFAFAKQTKNPRKEAVEKVEKFQKI